MPKIITESEVEEACLEILKDVGYTILNGPEISEGGTNPERKYNEVVLIQRLRGVKCPHCKHLFRIGKNRLNNKKIHACNFCGKIIKEEIIKNYVVSRLEGKI